MIRCLALIALLAGCESSAFVDIRISAPAGVERVDLFVAPDKCEAGNQVETCGFALSWDESSHKVLGDIFILDTDATTTATKLDDGSFRIDLKHAEPPPSDNPNHVARMLFVGYADPAGDTATSAMMLDYVDLPLHDPQQWRVELSDVVPVPPVQPTVMKPAADANRLHFWNRSSDTLARCVVFERWRNGDVTREFLVPPGDTDCDDQQNECDPFYWNAAGQPPSPDKATCVTSAPLAGDPATNIVCQPGGIVCSETGPLTNTGCTPVSPLYCLTSGFCDTTCRASIPDCFQRDALGYVQCSIPHTAQGGPCIGSTINNVADLDLSALAGNGVTCKLPTFAKIMPPLMGLTGLMNPATLDSIVLQSGPVPSGPGNTGCHATLTWTGTAIDHSMFGALAVQLSNGTTAVVGLALDFGTAPVMTDTCLSEMICTSSNITPGDDATRCAYVP